MTERRVVFTRDPALPAHGRVARARQTGLSITRLDDIILLRPISGSGQPSHLINLVIPVVDLARVIEELRASR